MKFPKLILFLLVSFQFYSQEHIPFKQRVLENVKGDMVVIGNSILGVKGVIGSDSYGPNDPYNGILNNGLQNNKSTRFDRRYSDEGELLITDVLETTINNYNRAYIDIDDDINFNDRFDPIFKLQSANYTYGGSLNEDGNGSPTSLSNEGTFSSSGAVLNFNSNFVKIKKAFLYWSAVYPQETINTFSDQLFENSREVVVTSHTNGLRARTRQNIIVEVDSGASNEDRTSFGLNNRSDFTEIKILPPGADQYYVISADPDNAPVNPDGVKLETEVLVDGLEGSYYNTKLFGSQSGAGINNQPYVCVADVTPLFKSLESKGEDVKGFWTIGNVRATTGYRRGGGLSGGWTLAVIYEDEGLNATNKSICFYDGYANIRFNDNPVNVDIPDFKTLPEGPINAWAAVSSLEGDRGFANDQFSIQTETIISQLGEGASVPLMENSIPNNEINFFNSTITGLGGAINKSPNSSNTLGYDADHFRISNLNNSIFNNEEGVGSIVDNSARLVLSTEGDSYGVFFTAFAIESVDSQTDIGTVVVESVCDGSSVVFFDVLGDVDPRNFSISVFEDVFVNPSASAIDNVLRFGDEDSVNLTFPSNSFEDNSRLFAITQLESGGSLRIAVRDEISDITVSITIFIPSVASLNGSVELSRLPSENIDDPITPIIDEAKGDIFVEVNSGFSSYTYQLINTNNTDAILEDDSVVKVFGPTEDSNHIFTNLDSDTSYKVRIFSSSQAPASVNSLISESDKCVFETPTIIIEQPVLNVLDFGDEKDDVIKVFPNPVKDNLSFSLKVDKVELVGVNGKTLKLFYNVSEVDVESIDKGIYFLILHSDRGISVQKIIKN